MFRHSCSPASSSISITWRWHVHHHECGNVTSHVMDVLTSDSNSRLNEFARRRHMSHGRGKARARELEEESPKISRKRKSFDTPDARHCIPRSGRPKKELIRLRIQRISSDNALHVVLTVLHTTLLSSCDRRIILPICASPDVDVNNCTPPERWVFILDVNKDFENQALVKLLKRLVGVVFIHVNVDEHYHTLLIRFVLRHDRQ